MYKPIKFICKYCQKQIMMVNVYSYKHRKVFCNEPVCGKCCKRRTLSKSLFDDLPMKYHHYLYSKLELPFEIMMKYGKNSKTTKLYVNGKCEKCGCAFRIRWDKVRSRVVFPFRPICKHCIGFLSCGDMKVRERNSKIQSIVQNKPQRLEQNRETSHRLWFNPEYRRACLRAFEEHNKKIQNDPDYARQLRKQAKAISGKVLINNNWIDFDSSYELFFLIKRFNDYQVIRRCNFVIMYGDHAYHPDFFVIEKDGSRRIIEIKGFYNYCVKEKKLAAKRYIAKYDVADSYELYDIQRLLKEGILEGEGSGRAWLQIQRIYDGQNIQFTHDKHREIATIGRSRFYRKNKNKEH